MPGRYIVIGALWLAAAAAIGQDAGEVRKSVAAVRVATPPVLDGKLDDAAWREAASRDDFHVVVSSEFGVPGERSRVYVAFDDDNL
jgi:hypothetical protein